jgi:hypothetical protein
MRGAKADGNHDGHFPGRTGRGEGRRSRAHRRDQRRGRTAWSSHLFRAELAVVHLGDPPDHIVIESLHAASPAASARCTGITPESSWWSALLPTGERRASARACGSPPGPAAGSHAAPSTPPRPGRRTPRRAPRTPGSSTRSAPANPPVSPITIPATPRVLKTPRTGDATARRPATES